MKQAQKGFRPLSAMFVIVFLKLFGNYLKFLWIFFLKLFGNFLNFFGLEEFFEGIFLVEFFFLKFLGHFFGGFLEGIL